MTSKLLTFFSSDAAPLYKADVFRALALPEGYVLQFRYPLQYIDPSFGGNFSSFVGRKGCIFFVHGNDLSLPSAKRPHQVFSIREVTVSGFFLDETDTEQTYFYLKLGQFKDYRDSGGVLRQQAAKDIYVSEAEFDLGTEHSWSDRVRAVSTFFPSFLFYGIKAVLEGSTVKTPVYDELTHSSRFDLNDESDYRYEMLFLDTTGGEAILKTESLSESLAVSIPAEFIVGAKTDHLTFPFQTGSLNRRTETATVRFLQDGISSAYRVDLTFRITRSWWKPVFFGLWTALAGLGLLLAQMVPKVITEIPPLTTVNFALGAAAVLFVGAGAGALYHLFNKK